MEVTEKIEYLIDNAEFMTEWHWEKNNKLGLNPEKLTKGSGKKAWWKCKNGHEWEAIISNRNKGTGCPYCSGRLPIIGETDLQTTNPKLSSEWHPSKNGNIKPTDVKANSVKKIWWQCKLGHEWQESPNNRTRGNGCPYCSNRKILKGFNDLATTHPELLKEWDYDKNIISPTQVSAGSHEYAWWKCDFGHQWNAEIKNRSQGCGCPKCRSKTSFPEQAILFYCNQITKAENRNVEFGKEIDIYMPEYKIGIEYNGEYWHKNRKDYDNSKKQYLHDLGIRLISINENRELNENSVLDDTINYIYNATYENLFCFVIPTIFSLIGVKKPDIHPDDDIAKIHEQYMFIKKENSLAVKYPELIKEWDYEKNGSLTPYMVSCNSNKKVWWKCANGHQWKSVIASRSAGCGCLECSRERAAKKRREIVYCVELNTVYESVAEAKIKTKACKVDACCRGERKKSNGYHWKYLYDQTRKDGTIIQGAISLGLITKEEALKQLEDTTK